MSAAAAKIAREAMHAKAKRLVTPYEGRVDASDWSQAGPMDADVQTGERPVSRRQFKRGGQVEGTKAPARADKTPRGIAPQLINRDVRAANEDRAGKKHVGGFANGGVPDAGVPTSRFNITSAESRLSKAAGLKTGGRAKRGFGGALGLLPELVSPDKKNPDARARGGHVTDGTLTGPSGGREPRKQGGAAHWIKDAIGKPGALHREMGVPEGEKIPKKKLDKAAESGGKLGKRARLAETLERMPRKSGGRTRRDDGGEVLGDAPGGGLGDLGVALGALVPAALNGYMRGRGSRDADKADRDGRKNGGRAGKMNVNIIIGEKPPAAPMPVPMPPPSAGPPPPPMPVGAPPMMPPGGPPPMGAGAPPIMPRKRGGRTYPLDAGAGSGLGRLEKIR